MLPAGARENHGGATALYAARAGKTKKGRQVLTPPVGPKEKRLAGDSISPAQEKGKARRAGKGQAMKKKRSELIYCIGGVVFLASAGALAMLVFLAAMKLLPLDALNLIAALGMLGVVSGNFLCSASGEDDK